MWFLTNQNIDSDLNNSKRQNRICIIETTRIGYPWVCKDSLLGYRTDHESYLSWRGNFVKLFKKTCWSELRARWWN